MSALLTVSDVVGTFAQIDPEKVGARDSRRALTYRQWDVRSARLANSFLSMGLSKGDRVALLAYNCVEWMEMYVALARAGLVAVPINFRLLGPEIHYIVQDCQARLFVVQDALVHSVLPIRDQLNIPEQCFVHFGDGRPPEGWSSYEAVIEHASPDAVNMDGIAGLANVPRELAVLLLRVHVSRRDLHHR